MDLGGVMSFNVFRNWVINSWWENCDERLTYKEHPVTLEEYVQQNKWYLKRKFKEMQK
jgi:hypothetical protein